MGIKVRTWNRSVSQATGLQPRVTSPLVGACTHAEGARALLVASLAVERLSAFRLVSNDCNARSCVLRARVLAVSEAAWNKCFIARPAKSQNLEYSWYCLNIKLRSEFVLRTIVIVDESNKKLLLGNG